MSDPLLALGSKGEAVATAKRLLNFHLYLLPPLTNLNEFDSDTQTRTIAFQRMSRLYPDGIIGPLTTGRLASFARMNLDGAVAQQTPLFGYRKSFVPKLELDVPKFGVPSQPGYVPRLGKRPTLRPTPRQTGFTTGCLHSI